MAPRAAGAGSVLTTPLARQRVAGAHFLLPNYDEYLIAYKDREAVLDPARARNLGIYTAVEFPHHLVVDGQVAGSWKRDVTAASARVTLRWHAPPTPRQRAALSAQAARFGRFLGVPCEVAHDGQGGPMAPRD